MDHFGKIASLSLCVALAAACNPFPEGSEAPSSATAPSTAEEIIERYVTAIGGAEKLKPLAQRTVEATVSFAPQEGCEENDPRGCVWEKTSGQFSLYLTADGRMYRRMVLGDNVQERGFDGKQSWQFQVEPPLLILDDEAGTLAAREDALLHWYFDYQSRGIVPAIQDPITEKRADGTTVQLDGIVWSDKEGILPTRVIWFDRGTGLMYQEIEKDKQTGDMVKRVYDDYREVDGVKVAFTLDQTSTGGGMTQEVELRFDEVHHRPLNQARFAVPELPKVDPVPDELLAYLEAARTAVKSNPKEPQAQVALARVAFAAAHFEEARAAAKATLALDPREPEAMWIVARVQLLQGDLRGARSSLDKAEKLGVRPDQVARQKAWLAMRRFDWKGAGKHLSNATLIAGNPGAEQIIPMTELGERYSAFRGKPLQLSMSACTVEVPLVSEVAPIFEIEVDGEKFPVLLDTGASDLILGEQLARSLVITADADAPVALGGPAVPQGQADSLKLGGLEVKNVPVTMFDAAQIAEMAGEQNVAGVIGLRTFPKTQITYDRGAGTLRIIKAGNACNKQRVAEQLGTRVSFVVHESHYIYVTGAMNGAEGLYLLNSGMRGAAVTGTNMAYAHAGIGAPPMRPGEAMLVGIDTLTMGEHEQKNVTGAYGYLAQDATSDGFRLDGMLGLDAMGGRWTIDLESQALWIGEGSVARPTKAKAKAKE